VCRGDIHIVRVDSLLDRETTREYNITILAMDGGNPSRSVTARDQEQPQRILRYEILDGKALCRLSRKSPNA
jgi:hypothetical protein